MKWQAKVLELLIAFAVLFGAYLWVGHHAVSEYKQEQLIVQMEKDNAQQVKYNKLAQDYEVLKVKRDTNAKTIIREVEKIVDRPVYLNECLDDDGLRIANEAIRGQGASKSDAEVPAN